MKARTSLWKPLRALYGAAQARPRRGYQFAALSREAYNVEGHVTYTSSLLLSGKLRHTGASILLVLARQAEASQALKSLTRPLRTLHGP